MSASAGTRLATKKPRVFAQDYPLIVAIGASAGGLAAFTALLKAVPSKSGISFVLIQHLGLTDES